MKDELPAKLAQQGLKTNESKTKEHTIKRANCDNRWRDMRSKVDSFQRRIIRIFVLNV